MAKPLDVSEFLGHLPIFRTLDHVSRQELADAARAKRLVKHEYLFRRGDLPTGMYIVVVGTMKLSIPDVRNNLEKVVEFIAPGEVFGEALMFLAHPYPTDAQALDDCLVIWIDRSDIDRLIDHDPLFARRMLTSLSVRFERLLHDIETISLHTADERLVDYLLRQSREGDTTRLMFNKRVIASKLGLKPETLSRSLQHLSAEGLISVNGARVQILDEERLTRMVSDLCEPFDGPDSSRTPPISVPKTAQANPSGVGGNGFEQSAMAAQDEGRILGKASALGW